MGPWPGLRDQLGHHAANQPFTFLSHRHILKGNDAAKATLGPPSSWGQVWFSHPLVQAHPGRGDEATRPRDPEPCLITCPNALL